MRKYLIGFITGLLFAIALPAAAEITSLVGKTIDAEYPVVVNGKELPVKATSIEGVSSTPNRALADALNLDISFSNNTVIIESKEGSTVEVPVETTPPKNTPQLIPMEPDEVEALLESMGLTDPKEQEVPASNYTLEQVESSINATQSTINFTKYNIDRLNNTPELKNLPDTQAEIKKLQAYLAEREAELELWKQRKAELEAQQNQ